MTDMRPAAQLARTLRAEANTERPTWGQAQQLAQAAADEQRRRALEWIDIWRRDLSGRGEAGRLALVVLDDLAHRISGQVGR